ncbi:hypothetical protein V8F06_002959 [Rhypophila decipiens]
MGDALKRTFHGCLTCRKRKVRCRGGDPCQNCARMNITCHSSFDTNLRIRVSTSTGQKDVGSRPKPKLMRATNNIQPTMMATRSAFIEFDGISKPYAASFQDHVGSFQLTAPTPVFTQEPQSIPLLGSASEINTLQYQGVWGYDFSLDPAVDHALNQRHDVSLGATIYAPPGTYPAASRQVYPISDSEGSMSSKSQTQNLEGTKEWVPRRRKRPRKTSSSQAHSGNGAGMIPGDCAGSQEYTAFLQNNPWTLEGFALNFVQKCAPQCPLRQAVMAWSSRESATGLTAIDPSAETCYIQASNQIDKFLTLANPTVQLGNLASVTTAAEYIICTSFFLNRYDIAAGDIEVADSRLERMARWLGDHPGDLNLSGFASKLLLYSCYLHIRISMFGGAYPRYTFLLDVLLDRPDHHQIVHNANSFYWDMFGNSLPKELVDEKLEEIPISQRLHELFCLLAGMLHYRSAQRSQGISQDPGSWEEHIAARHTGIENDLQRAEAEFHLAGAVNPSAGVLRRAPMGGLAVLTSTRFSQTPPDLGDIATSPSSPISASSAVSELDNVSALWLTAYASFLTAKIMWSRITQPAIRTDNASAAAAETIIQIALLLRRGRWDNQLDSSSLVLWPLPLFVAGIETLDEVRSDWVRLFMSGMQGVGIRPGSGSELLSLMEEVRRRQDETGTRIFVDETMAETGRLRGIFAFRG